MASIVVRVWGVKRPEAAATPMSPPSPFPLFVCAIVVVWPTVQQADPHAPHETLRYGYGSAFVAETLLCAVTTFVHLVAHYKAGVDGSPAYGVAVGGVTLATVQCLVGDGARGSHVVQGPVSVGACK